MLESYESVNPTAILTSYPRIFTDIPYEKEIYEWLSKNCSEEVQLNKLLASEIEARYKLANKLMDKLNITQVLNLQQVTLLGDLYILKKDISMLKWI